MLTELRDSVRGQLDALRLLVRDGEDRVVAEVARAELPHVLDALWRLAVVHAPDESGHCAACAPPAAWWRFKRRPTVPCRALLTARRQLLGDPTPHPRHAYRER